MRFNGRFLIGIFSIAILILIVIFNTQNPLPAQVCISETCFNLEIAETLQEKALGLSNRVSLPEDNGMLFIYSDDVPGFWMKDMNFPLDIIWINSEMKVSEIVRGIEPCEPDFCPVVYPAEGVIYVLEINAGLSDLHGFQSGDAVYFK